MPSHNKPNPHDAADKRRLRPRCGLCFGPHHAFDCPRSIEDIYAIRVANRPDAPSCQRCSTSTLGGPYCIGCTLDRITERLLGKDTN